MASLKKLWSPPLPAAPEPFQSLLALTLRPRKPAGSVAKGKATIWGKGGEGKVEGTRSELSSWLVRLRSNRTRTRDWVNSLTRDRVRLETVAFTSFRPSRAKLGPPSLPAFGSDDRTSAVPAARLTSIARAMPLS